MVASRRINPCAYCNVANRASRVGRFSVSRRQRNFHLRVVGALVVQIDGEWIKAEVQGESSVKTDNY